MAAAAEYSSFQLAGKLLKVAMTLFYPGAKCIWWLIWTIVLLLAVRHFQPYALLTFVYPHQLVFKPDYWPVEMDTEPHNLLTPAAPPSLPPRPPCLPAFLSRIQLLPLGGRNATRNAKRTDTRDADPAASASTSRSHAQQGFVSIALMHPPFPQINKSYQIFFFII